MRNLSKYVAVCVLIALISTMSAQAGPRAMLKKVVDPEWLRDATLKHGFLASLCVTQTFTGMTEGYHFSQETKHIVTRQNYHTFESARRAGWMVTGWFEYANMVDKKQTNMGKFRRFLGAAFMARNRFEWGYKAQRYGNPFDYSKAHNKHAIFYVGYQSGGAQDFYFGTGPLTGPLVDIGFEIIGRWLFK